MAMASECAHALVKGDIPPFGPLVADLRRDLRVQLGLTPLDATLQLPAPGPLRGGRGGKMRAGVHLAVVAAVAESEVVSF